LGLLDTSFFFLKPAHIVLSCLEKHPLAIENQSAGGREKRRPPVHRLQLLLATTGHAIACARISRHRLTKVCRPTSLHIINEAKVFFINLQTDQAERNATFYI
jgi:hypothetical protein